MKPSVLFLVSLTLCIAACSPYQQLAIAPPSSGKNITITIEATTGTLVYYAGSGAYKPLKGERKRILELLDCTCWQPADDSLLVIAQFNARTKEITGYALLALSPKTMTWQCVYIAPSSGANPYAEASISGDTVSTTLADGSTKQFDWIRKRTRWLWIERT